MRIKNLLIICLLMVFCNCSEKPNSEDLPRIIPIPSNMLLNSGQFILSNATKINASEEFKVSSEFLKAFIINGSKIKLNTNSFSNSIDFIKDEKIENKEGYKLIISENKITIFASTDQGAFYAVQTFRQLLPAAFENGTFQENQIAIRCLNIEDEPRFEYRGMHLDVGRHMFPVDFIKKYIDALAMLKMNTFHWHLTEDQGWRIEIKKYPKLNEVAAFRSETLVGHYNDQPHQFDGKRYGGFYTQEQIKDIVKFADSRKVTIIPEIELPGHSQAAIAAYPEFGCTEKPVEVATLWGVFENIYCPKEETFAFLEDVFDEVIALFPGEYIHIGGDEAPKTHWKNCENCQALIKKRGLRDEHELQSYFISRIEKYLNNKGKQIIGWDEILEGGLAPNATVMSWRGMDGAIEAAQQNHNVILTPQSHCYFDHYQSTNPDEPLAIGGFLPLEKVYGFNPIPAALSSEQIQFVLGAQGNVWTEYMPEFEQVEYMAFPRTVALSEVVWSRSELKNYENFVSRLEHLHNRLNVLDINYANHLYEVEGQVISYGDLIKYQLSKTSEKNQIVYSMDGNDPKYLNNAVYDQPIVVDKSMTIKAATFNSEGERLSEIFSKDINLHNAVGKKIKIDKEPHKAYQGSGANGLINGISGSDSRYGDKEWLGFWGEDIEITIDLGTQTEINSIQTRFHNGTGQWIYAPKSVEITFDSHKISPAYNVKTKSGNIVEFNERTKLTSRFIYLKIRNFGTIPEGQQGSGHKAWTFIDEIIIN